MENIIGQFLKDNWREIAGEKRITESLSIIKLSGQASDEATLNFIVFARKDNLPKYFLKVNRKPNDFAVIEQEFDNLKRLKETLNVNLSATMPDPLFLGKIDDYTIIMIESFLPGKKIDLNNYSQLSHLCAKSFAWLKAFYLAGKSGEVNFKWVDFAETIHRITRNISIDNELKSKLEVVTKQAKAYDGINLPLSFVQGDFDFDNILVNNGNITIVDWEDYKTNSLPFIDTEFFIFNIGLYFYEKDTHIKSFNKFFLKHSSTYKLVDYYLSDYCQYLGLSKSIFYFISIMDTIKIIRCGYGRHHRVPIQDMDFLDALVELSLREIV